MPISFDDLTPGASGLAFNGSPATSQNLDAAHAAMNLSPQERALYQRHLTNLAAGGVAHPGGGTSTLYQSVQQGPDGKFYNVPTVWNGKIETEKWTRPADGKVFDIPNSVARQNIDKAGLQSFPSYDTPEAADARYSQMHGYMEKDTNAAKATQGMKLSPTPQLNIIPQPQSAVQPTTRLQMVSTLGQTGDGIEAPEQQKRVFPTPPYYSGPGDESLLKNPGLPPDRNTFDADGVMTDRVEAGPSRLRDI